MSSMRKTLLIGPAILLILAGCPSSSKQAAKSSNPTATSEAGARAALVTAYVASGLIPKGTTGKEAFAENLLEPQRIKAASLPPHALTNPDAISDKVANADIGAGKFVLETDFASK